MLLLLQVMYLTIAGKALQLFDCTELADGSVVLEAAPYIRCWRRNSEHAHLVVMGTVAVVVYVVGIPALFWWVLRWARASERAWEAVAPPGLLASGAGLAQLRMSQEQAQAWRGAERAVRVAGNLSQRFRPAKWHWLLVVMARRLALVCAFVFLTSRPQTQLALVALVLLVALELQHLHRPYANSETANRRKRTRDMAQELDSRARRVEVELVENPLWRRQGEAEKRVRQAAVVRRLRRSTMEADKSPPRQQQQPGGMRSPRSFLRWLVGAAEDANAMEWVALVAALLVLLSALVYHASRQELVVGTEERALNVRLFVTDLCCVCLLSVTCTYMTAMATAPLLGAVWKMVKRRARRPPAVVCRESGPVEGAR